MNTKISYLYRDASNYKVPNECIVRGLLTDEQTKAILDCLDSDNFIPSQVGLPERRFDRFDPEEDTCWFELYESGFEPTDAEATVDLSVDELVSRFLARKDRWDDTVILTSRSVLSSQTEPAPKRRMLSMSGSPVNRAHSGLRLLPTRPPGSPSVNSREPYLLPWAPSLTCPASFRS